MAGGPAAGAAAPARQLVLGLGLLLLQAATQVHSGTLFGVQFEGDVDGGLSLYALPTVDPTLPLENSLVMDQLPIQYERTPIAIGSTGLRRFRRKNTVALGVSKDDNEARFATHYYNLVPNVTTLPAATKSVEVDAQTGDVIVEEMTIGPLMAFQFSSDGDMYGLVPALASGTAAKGVEVKRFREAESGFGQAVHNSWVELGSTVFSGSHAVFGLR